VRRKCIREQEKKEGNVGFSHSDGVLFREKAGRGALQIADTYLSIERVY
jgi:hypothetical protein